MREYQSAEIKDLAAALCKAQTAMKHATKEAENPYFKSKYADLPAVIDAVRPALTANGLSVSQMMDYDEVGRHYLVTTLMHTSGQWLRGWYPINPTKNDPQGIGSAVTYARRYSLAGATGNASIGEDDDGNAASEVAPHSRPSPSAKEIYGTNGAMSDKFTEIKEAILGAQTHEQLKSIWKDNNSHILAMKKLDQTYYDDLEKVKEKQKTVISNNLAIQAAHGSEFSTKGAS